MEFGPRTKTKISKAVMNAIMTTPAVSAEQLEKIRQQKRLARQRSENAREARFYRERDSMTC
ncbi:hypothetical protein [Undibacterium oligocarboniphilum]|uniref:Uncharacterized protein n=1 Tax=Undibacterium oligocarboniphilum TaxID=666702 RepID=A0A850QEP8_9BURK|nr:hypothetical protein [Undibacterium oligocarboniphilum]MBC3871482.1 hypothetical protein [Undibacterium oligocarboniphilum]NVO78942.1 hypothetical protein [Undibacterium oligocarboniphilum]